MIGVMPGGRFMEIPRETETGERDQSGPGTGLGVDLAVQAGPVGLEVFAGLQGTLGRLADGLDRDRDQRGRPRIPAWAITPFYIPATPIPLVGTSGTLDVPEHFRPTLGRYWDISNVIVTGFAGTTPNVSQPAVPATGVAQQNVNQFPVQVVISPNGATITNVSVNGVTVGTAAGTYTVPANGSISIAYSVATPTWVWSALTTTAGTITGLRNGIDPAIIIAAPGEVTYGKATKVLRGNGERIVWVASGVTGSPSVSFAGQAVNDAYWADYVI